MTLSKENRLQMTVLTYKKGQIKLKPRAAKVFEALETTSLVASMRIHTEMRVNGHKMTAIKKEVLVKQVLEGDK